VLRRPGSRTDEAPPGHTRWGFIRHLPRFLTEERLSPTLAPADMTGVHVLGSHAAGALIDVGLGRADVIRILMKDLALTNEEAAEAWRCAAELRPARERVG
jgi:hypothetical protein